MVLNTRLYGKTKNYSKGRLKKIQTASKIINGLIFWLSYFGNISRFFCAEKGIQQLYHLGYPRVGNVILPFPMVYFK